jgi:D-glutamate cyclase
MTLDDRLRAIRDVIQRDIGERGLARDAERNLVNACPNDFANACRNIGENASPSVAIITGFWIAHAVLPCGETDGPLGAVYLAAALQSIGVSASIITDSFCEEAIKVGIEAGNLSEEVSVLKLPPYAVTMDMAGNRLGNIWDSFIPNDWHHFVNAHHLTHLIALERVGPARDDRCYSMRGRDITDFTCPAHLLFEDAVRRQSRLETIGIGDGGNEIGMGKIPPEVIERNIPNGRKIASRVATDQLIVAGISNWGAYALAVGVALVRGQKLDAALFDSERERKILQLMVECGPLVDGKTAQPTATVDGIAFDDYIQPQEAIRVIAEM